MKLLLKATIAAAALMAASPALADVVDAKSSDSQGTLVHANGGGADVATQVTGTLGGGPSAPEIVQFTGSTSETVDRTDANDVRLQQGAGQAELTGAVISGQNFHDLQSGDIWLEDATGILGMEWIELAFQNLTLLDGFTEASVEFTISLLGEPDVDFSFDFDSLSGEQKFAFLAINGEVMTNLHYALIGANADGLRQVRIASVEAGVPPIPEPATWAMMLLGFAGAGIAIRRSRRRSGELLQLA